MKGLLTLLLAFFMTAAFGQVKQKRSPSDFLPKGEAIFKKVNGT